MSFCDNIWYNGVWVYHYELQAVHKVWFAIYSKSKSQWRFKYECWSASFFLLFFFTSEPFATKFWNVAHLHKATNLVLMVSCMVDVANYVCSCCYWCIRKCVNTQSITCTRKKKLCPQKTLSVCLPIRHAHVALGRHLSWLNCGYNMGMCPADFITYLK